MTTWLKIIDLDIPCISPQANQPGLLSKFLQKKKKIKLCHQKYRSKTLLISGGTYALEDSPKAANTCHWVAMGDSSFVVSKATKSTPVRSMFCMDPSTRPPFPLKSSTLVNGKWWSEKTGKCTNAFECMTNNAQFNYEITMDCVNLKKGLARCENKYSIQLTSPAELSKNTERSLQTFNSVVVFEKFQ